MANDDVVLIFRDLVVPEPGARVHPDLKHGRKIEHDSRSRDHAHGETVPRGRLQALTLRKPKPKTVFWTPSIAALNQGNLGACTGNAAAGLLATGCPGHEAMTGVNEDTARWIYSEATRLDGFPGQWPPTDTGSSGLAVMKVLKKHKAVKSYRHCFSVNSVIAALQAGPVITGIAWRQDMYEPGPDGFASYSGPVVGGHEFMVTGVDLQGGYFKFRNSWGSGWGVQGDFFMSLADYSAALENKGDATVPVWCRDA